eukprot:CAMPEP_0197516104 /NCGR_PEP_ID=MMETSP1318-20131121/991_1 /TAXON_ID=552666 /ORGANISM="Partenskyella glossopodia, Strain RCC365" /LENGTH=74 /DNA_ID=CAMNT_0043064621 /DNA_START=682 /DNA_END=906 /DNA_ORIENTATION=-
MFVRVNFGSDSLVSDIPQTLLLVESLLLFLVGEDERSDLAERSDLTERPDLIMDVSDSDTSLLLFGRENSIGPP